MVLKTVLITPEIAVEILKKNNINRRKKIRKVDQYTDDMKSGRCKTGTAESIKIASTGHLVDGQHRLMAVVKSGVAIEFLVAYEVDPKLMDVIDTGVVRTGADVFHIEGVKNSMMLPSIIRYYLVQKTGYEKNNWEAYTNTILLNAYYERESFWQSVAVKTLEWYVVFGKVMSKSEIGGFYALFYDIDLHDAKDFMEKLCTGHNVKTMAITLLRNTITNDKLSVSRMPRPVKYALIIKAWNCFRKKEAITQLVYDPKNHVYPIPV